MLWTERFPALRQPEFDELCAAVDSPYWAPLCAACEAAGGQKAIEYSKCCGAPGWNVKFRRSGRSLCVLYPDSGHFTCMVTVGPKEQLEAEALLPTFSPETAEIYRRADAVNGARWLMLPVDSRQAMADALALIRLRLPAAKRGML